MSTNTKIHEYLGEYDFMSIMLVLAVLNKREIGRREFNGGEVVLNKWKLVRGVVSCPWTLI